MDRDMHDTIRVFEMTFLTIGGWVLSLQEVEVIARIISLIVPTILSILIYKRSLKDKEDDNEE